MTNALRWTTLAVCLCAANCPALAQAPPAAASHRRQVEAPAEPLAADGDASAAAQPASGAPNSRAPLAPPVLTRTQTTLLEDTGVSGTHGTATVTSGASGTLEPSPTPTAAASADNLFSWESWTSPARLGGSLRFFAVTAVLSLAPALLLMTTSYVRIVVVLSLLRQALGNQQLPPNQVTTTLALFLTFLIMSPVWMKVHEQAILPYTDPRQKMSLDEAWTAGVGPIREFMSQQIARAGNGGDVRLFLDYLPPISPPPQSYADVPLQALLPAFLVSELKLAFVIGFQIYLPFVIIDLVVSSVTMSMGMVMVPPMAISLPLKLLLFVLADGWHLIVEMLLSSFQSVA